MVQPRVSREELKRDDLTSSSSGDCGDLLCSMRCHLILWDICYSDESLALQELRGYSLYANGGIGVIAVFCSRMTRAGSKTERDSLRAISVRERTSVYDVRVSVREVYAPCSDRWSLCCLLYSSLATGQGLKY